MNKFKIFGCFAIAMMAVASFFLANNNSQKSGDIMMSNIESLHASAAEARCNAANSNRCEIFNVGIGTGELIKE